MKPSLSVIIRSKDEADRLRLTLTSLSIQSHGAEIVVVNDGSSDHTRDVLQDAASDMSVTVIHHDQPVGRSAASNIGARAASGDILLFLDGDTLAAPDLVESHLTLHQTKADLICRGSTYHLRCTRPFLDPEAGTPQAGQEEKVERMSDADRKRALVTRQQIRQAFDEIDQRAQPGVYPGFGPRKLFALEMGALTETPDCPVLWAAASGANQSLSRTAFLEAGGFLPEIDNNEHRELALRLAQRGLTMVGNPGRSYHMTHRSGWRDPLEQADWEAIFFAAHPIPEVALLRVLWSTLSDTTDIPKAAQLHSLPELADAADRYRHIKTREGILSAHLAREGKFDVR